jgi:peptide-methionine (S)-S-oxide reductase
MRSRRSRSLIALLVFVTLVPCVALAASTAPKSAAATKPTTTAAPAKPVAVAYQTATFAGGCFWCVETDFEQRPGIVSVVSGFTGGQKLNPTYEEVSAGGTGHAESVEITFDPAKVTYAKLLEIFWHSIDPTQANGQFCDHGNQYRSAIFYHDETQHRLADQSKRDIEASKILKKPIVTQIVAATKFYPAEEYHQDFWKKDPERYHSYREGCGRDKRLVEVWGKLAEKPSVH